MKHTLYTVIILCVCAASIHATGVGPALCVAGGAAISGDTDGAVAIGIGCSVKLDALPIYWELDTGAYMHGTSIYDGMDSYFDATLTGDVWIINPDISRTWKWYLGAGGAVSAGFGGNGYFAAGPRVVIGLNSFSTDGFTEIFIQGAAQVQAIFELYGYTDEFARITVPISAGMRLWY